jgi:hypothetical protein
MLVQIHIVKALEDIVEDEEQKDTVIGLNQAIVLAKDEGEEYEGRTPETTRYAKRSRKPRNHS